MSLNLIDDFYHIKNQVLYAVKKVNKIQDHSVNVFEIFCSFNR